MFQIRWLIRRDMPEVLKIENESFDSPWTEEDFMCCLTQRNCIGMVVEDTQDRKIVGFMIYELHKSKLHILNTAVEVGERGKGYGRAMIERMVDKLHQQRRSEIYVEVRERNLSAQLFFRHMRFRAVSVLKDIYEGTDEWAFLMKYALPQEPSNPRWSLRNRISSLPLSSDM